MQRRTIAQTEPGSDLESVVSSSQGSLPSKSPSKGRKSLAVAVTDRALQDATRSKFFPFFTLLMEMSFSFVQSSCEVYAVYALGGYTSTLQQLDAIDLMIKYRFIGCVVVVLVGIVCDSYIGTFYPLMCFLCVLTAFMGLHAVISLPLPWMFISTDTKLLMAKVTFITFALFIVMEPLIFVTTSRAIMETNYFRESRTFYALLACAHNVGIGAGGTVLYFSTTSRYALCTIMFANLGLIILITVFYVVSRKKFIGGRTPEIGVVEKALAALICRTFMYFDKYVLRKLIFKHSSGIEGDYRCFKLSQNTVKNAKALVGIVLVTLPLFIALSMIALVDTFYYVQLSMFYYYPVEPYPLLSMKGYIFLLLFPLVEYWIFPALKKWSASEASRQLTMVGVGSICVSMALVWSFVIYKVVRGGNEFWYTFHPGTGNIAITNCLNEPLSIRSQFMNYIMHDDDGWTELPPFKTLKILNIPVSPFHFELSNKLSTYDEYYLPIRMKQSSWYVILPTGVFPLPPYCFRRNQRHIVMTTSFYGPATICVVCALTFCNGYVRFDEGIDANLIHKSVAPLVPLTGRGTNSSIEYHKIMAELIGKYNVSAVLGGVDYTSSTATADFSRTDTYMVVIYESPNETKWKKEEHTIAHAVEPDDDIDLIRTFIIKTSPRSTFNVAWMYPSVFIHALSEVIYLVSLWMFLFGNTPDQIRTTVFCFVRFLSIPAYGWMYEHGAMSLRHLTTMQYFYLAAINCLSMIVYFFCILFFIHKLFKVKPTLRSAVEQSSQKRQSAMDASTDEQKGK